MSVAPEVAQQPGNALPRSSHVAACCEQDREATLQCILCLRAKVDLRKSYSCSTDCLRQHWGLHRDLHVNGGAASAASGAFILPSAFHQASFCADIPVQYQVTRAMRMAMPWRPASRPATTPLATGARLG